jgi:large subunit ribosomal protein L18
MSRINLNLRRQLRKRRNRARIFGTALQPRLSVFRSNRFIYTQLIDDEKGVTLASVSSKETRGGIKTNQAEIVGQLLAEKAKKIGIKKVVFNKGSYKYHGRVKALAEGVRKGGLEF